MKRLSLLILFVVLAMSANAQLKVGILTHKIKILEEEPVLPNGYTVFYTEVGNGSKVRIYYGSNDEANGDRIWEDGVYPASYVKFTGYYCGEITDPTDDIVNIRKGPGTQYAVLIRYGWMNLSSSKRQKPTGISFITIAQWKETLSILEPNSRAMFIKAALKCLRYQKNSPFYRYLPRIGHFVLMTDWVR